MKSARAKPAYSLGDAGEFVITNYNQAKPFASFFPGIAGPHGIPMWVFYVNRGQCVCSMGIEDKEHPIMEFLSANRAYQLTSNQGFRTFLKIRQGAGKPLFYEPFQDQLPFAGMRRTQRMIILPAHLTLVEENETLGLRFSVDYFNVPEDSYAGLVRVLKIENTGRKPVGFEMLDGLPLIVPYGVDNYNLKHMRRLVESFVECVNYKTSVPFFKGKVKQEDRPEIVRIREGNFYLGFVGAGTRARIVRPLVDPEFVFGSLTDFTYPQAFVAETPFRIKPGQILENRLPCAMGLVGATVRAGGCYTYTSVVGSTSSVQALSRLAPRIASGAYVERKRTQNADLVEQLTQHNFAHGASHAFDLYCRQNFLDNTLRGGLPVTLADGPKTTTLHLYSRKHGDLERDYNDYRLSATNYSQGNGNFRDVNQNRRNDLFINPDIRESNVEHFYNLIQLDGFNPLIVKATSFGVQRKKELDRVLRKAFARRDVAAVRDCLSGRRFAPGQVMSFLAEKGIRLRRAGARAGRRPQADALHATDEFIGKLLSCCEKHQETDVGHGYWSDHWTYNLDLLENYLAVYPERLRYILLQKKTFTFFDSWDRVMPRDDKYVLWDGLPMQLGAVQHDHEKEQMIRQRAERPHEVRTQLGKGDVYRTTLINKMLCLVLNKLASLDPFGVGIEMESDKPNWYDALNGLPGQLGSSISETLELKRLIVFMLDSLKQLGVSADDAWPLFAEAEEFMDRLARILKTCFRDRAARRDFEYWDKATAAKEEYREKTRFGITGSDEHVRVAHITAFLELALEKLNIGIACERKRAGKVPRTYFINKVVAHDLIHESGPGGRKVLKRNKKGQPCYRAKQFRQVPLPLFLEGPVHFLRVEKDPGWAKALARNIRMSGLFDRKLKMYKVNESLADQPLEIGRTRTFSRGWLENESIWLHMEYKYLLELLRAGLHEEFYRDIKTMLVPFLEPEVYGRSILENSSFIASSANPDPKVHGTGFVARLSGSTAEFIHILLAMAAGERPFRLGEKGDLQVRLEPALAGHLFSKRSEKIALWVDGKRKETEFPANTFSFNFMGCIVTYHNPLRRNTFGRGAVKPAAWKITNREGVVTRTRGGFVTGVVARELRERKLLSMEIELQ